MKRRLIVGNWKMHCGVSDALKLVTGLEHHIKTNPDIDVAVAPPDTSLYSVSIALQESHFQLAAQNCHWEDKGAFTGETSAAFLAEMGCSYVIIGHSERRQHFAETDAAVAKKVDAAKRNNLIPIVCVGETEEEREANKTWDVLERQIKIGLGNLHTKEIDRLVVAYEPVWAIGTGKTASPGQASEAHSFIRNQLEKLFDAPSAADVYIVYGGSVKGANAEALAREPMIDGCLVGGASLDPEDFAKIVRAMERPGS